MGKFPFIGPSYNLASVSADAQECMNWLVEPDETGKGRSQLVLKRTPGLTVFCDLTVPPNNGGTAVGGSVRGMWAGEFRLFAVAGSSFIEILSDGTYNNRSGPSFVENGVNVAGVSVGTDGKPVSILANGTQVLIVSAGYVYCDNGLGPQQVAFNPGSGTVNTNGTAVTWESGSQFFDLAAGQLVTINGAVVQIQTVTDETDIVLVLPIGVQNNVPWEGFGNNGIIHFIENLVGNYTTVELVSGDPFPPNITQFTTAGGIIGSGITWDSPTQLTLRPAGPPSGPNVAYGANTPISAFMGTYMDTYFIVAQPSSPVFYISANDDGTTWSAIDQATKEGYPDNIAFVKADHEQLIIGGDECSLEVWLDTGAALFPFQRNASQTIHWGCRASWSVVRYGNGIAWIGGDQERGGPYAFYMEGSSETRISTYAIEQAWSKYAVVSDAVAMVKVEDGHEILIISFPTADATWAYDRTASLQLGIPCWHRRGFWNTDAVPYNARHRASTHASVVLATVGKVPPVQPPQSYVGDWQLGKIYTTSQAMVNDNGTQIVRVRIAPNVAGADNLEVSYDRFELLVDLGPATGGPAPLPVSPTLSYSNDGAHTWRNPQTRTTSPGLTDQWQSRFVWRRQGQSRPRTYQLVMNDQSQFTVLDAFVEADQGNG